MEQTKSPPAIHDMSNCVRIDMKKRDFAHIADVIETETGAYTDFLKACDEAMKLAEKLEAAFLIIGIGNRR